MINKEKISIFIKNKTAKGSLYLSLSQVVFVLTGYLIHTTLGRKLGPIEYGAYSVVVSIVSLINLILTTGIPNATSKLISEDSRYIEKIKKDSLWLQAFLGVTISFVLFILSKDISSLLGDLTLEPYIKIVSPMVFFYGLYSLFIGYLNGLRQYKKQSMAQIVYNFFKLFFILGLVFLGYSIKGALFGFALSPLFGLLAALLLIDFRIGSTIDEQHTFVKKIILFSLPITFFSVVNNFVSSLDLLFVKSFIVDAANVGYYSAASTIAKTITYITIPISSAIFPAISSLTHKRKLEKSKIYIRKSFLYSFLIVFGFAFFFSLFAKQIVSLLYSSKYLPAVPSLRILSFGMAFFALYALAMTIMSGAGKLKSCIVI
ncbi:MAG: flippase, partial [Candidatus Pacebacteria bacterium]|nr:flippase [Candidatus Paceibacterota bacterium]